MNEQKITEESARYMEDFIRTLKFGVDVRDACLSSGIARNVESGWSCPRCSRIYGPSVQICCVCNTKVASKEIA